MENEKNYFSELNAVNVNGKTEKKNGLTYLSWAWAWGEIKKAHPDTTYTVYENAAGWNYHTDGKTCWVKCGVTCNGIENIEYLPVMDFKNRSIPADCVTSMDVNKAIQRCLTKAVGRHGLGLYIYAGEDMPEDDAETALKAAGATVAQSQPQMPYNPYNQYDMTEEDTKIPELGNLTPREIYEASGLDGIRTACKNIKDKNQTVYGWLAQYGKFKKAQEDKK